MPTITSTLRLAKANLYDLLVNHPFPVNSDGDVPTVQWSPPTEQDDVTGEMIYLDQTRMSVEWPTLGCRRFDETYALRVVIDITQWGDDERSTENRAMELYEEFVTLLHDHEDLDGAVNRTTGMTIDQSSAPAGPQQWQTRLIIDINCVGMVYYPTG